MIAYCVYLVRGGSEVVSDSVRCHERLAEAKTYAERLSVGCAERGYSPEIWDAVMEQVVNGLQEEL